MMTNLFSIFDPSSSTFNLSWMSIMLPILMILKTKFFYSKKYLTLNKIDKEMSALIPNPPKGMIYFIKTIFLFIFILNFLALFPFIFTPTAHMSISFSLAFSMWLMIMIFAWSFMTKHMLIHTIPMGTPFPLINFMFIIELVSNIIRPITLSVRLTANMVAGHLLMLLLSNFALSSSNNMMISSIPLLVLTMLEMAVSLIQAYVFVTLISLYINETM